MDELSPPMREAIVARIRRSHQGYSKADTSDVSLDWLLKKYRENVGYLLEALDEWQAFGAEHRVNIVYFGPYDGYRLCELFNVTTHKPSRLGPAYPNADLTAWVRFNGHRVEVQTELRDGQFVWVALSGPHATPRTDPQG